MTEAEEALIKAHNWMAITYGCIQSNLFGLLCEIDALEEQFPYLARPDYLPPMSRRSPTTGEKEG